MRRQITRSVLTVAVLLIGAWNVQSTGLAAADATVGQGLLRRGLFLVHGRSLREG